MERTANLAERSFKCGDQGYGLLRRFDFLLFHGQDDLLTSVFRNM